MRVLHIVKTADGARWAAAQAAVLRDVGIEVHVALPAAEGEAIQVWNDAGARLHRASVYLPVSRPWQWSGMGRSIRRLIDEVQPNLIHSHFVTSTLALRLALGPRHPVPRIFQVPGPLHLEHLAYRRAEIRSAGPSDYWIASSRYIKRLYVAAGVPEDRVSLSYYGTNITDVATERTSLLRQQLGIAPDALVVGNISHIYPPKYHLGQTKGLKRHEDLIDALAAVCRQRNDVIGVLIGSQWTGGDGYERRLRERARRLAGERIRFLKRIPFHIVPHVWPDFDCAIHLPISENCGGVVEPLAAGVPTIASQVGGLPEVVLDGLTGWLVPPREPAAAADRILQVLGDLPAARDRARGGRELVRTMFDVRRTGAETAAIYSHILDPDQPPPPTFDSRAAVLGRSFDSPKAACVGRDGGIV